MIAIDIAKGTVGTIASIGASVAVAAVIKSVVPADPTLIQKVAFGVGSAALGSAAGKVAADSTEEIIKDGIAFWQTIKEARQNKNSVEEIEEV